MGRGSYAYASAKVRALETHLMSDADFTRVIEAKNPDIAFKAFNSLDYAGELLDLESHQYRTAMSRKMKRLKKVLEKIVPDPKLLRLLFLERDYYNIKILFKEKVSGENYDDHLEDTPGLVRVDQLRRYIIDGLDADIDAEIKADIDELKAILGDGTDPERIDNFVDQRLNARNRALAKKLHNSFIIELYEYLADKNNLNIFLRAKRLGKDPSWVMSRLNDAGHIPQDVYRTYYESDDDSEFITKVASYMPSSFAPFVEEYLSGKHVNRIELGMNTVIMEHLKRAKFIGYGPEVVVAYFFAKKYSIKNLSVIMALKFGGVEPAEIRKQLVQHYTLP